MLEEKFDQLPLLIDLHQAARLVSTSESTLRKWAAGIKTPPENFPKFFKFGGRLMLRSSDLVRYVNMLDGGDAGAQTQDAQPVKRRRGRPRKVASVSVLV